jgi:hypothetical protein
MRARQKKFFAQAAQYPSNLINDAFSNAFNLADNVSKITNGISGSPDHTIPVKLGQNVGFEVLRGSGSFNIANASANKAEVQTLWDLRTQVASDYGGLATGMVFYKKYQSTWIFSKIGATSIHPFIVVPVIVKADGAPAATFETSKTEVSDIIDDAFAGEHNFQVLPPVASRLVLDAGNRIHVAEFKFDATAIFNRLSNLYYIELRNSVSSMFWYLMALVFAVDDGGDIGYAYVHFKESEVRNRPL